MALERDLIDYLNQSTLDGLDLTICYSEGPLLFDPILTGDEP